MCFLLVLFTIFLVLLCIFLPRMKIKNSPIKGTKKTVFVVISKKNELIATIKEQITKSLNKSNNESEIELEIAILNFLR